MAQIRIGVIGDLHTHWDAVDVAQFNRANYDLLLFTGDLGGGTPDSSLRIAKEMSHLRTPTLVMPGNNDTGDIAELAAELAHQGGMRRLLAMRDEGTPADVPVRLCGYSTHPLSHADVTLIAARPHSMGGASLSFPQHMRATYGVDSIEQSAERLRALVDQADTDQIVFLSHNGPLGLGDAPNDMWGCDFKADGGDWGDPDLTDAIDYAANRGRRVLAVVAGHMHLRTKCGRERPWQVEQDGIQYINAARVPRIFAANDDVRRHHVELIIGDGTAEANEIFVPESAG
jgi:uncharacterized protein (TIGR04168 family)